MGISTGIGFAGLSVAGCIGSIVNTTPTSTPSPTVTPLPPPLVPGQIPVDPADLLANNPLMAPLTDFQNKGEFGGDAVYDESVPTYRGQWKRSLMLSTTGAGNKNTTTRMAKFLSHGCNINQYQMWVNIDHPENLAALRIFFIGSTLDDISYVNFDLKNAMKYGQLTAGQWYRAKTLMTDPAGKGLLDPADIRQFRIQLTTTGPCAVHMNDLRMLATPDWLSGGAVMIVCDGGYSSQYTGIKTSLDRYGYKATLAVSSKYYGSSNYMSTVQLKELFAQGWDIGVHGSNPIPTDQMTEEALDQLWAAELDWIRAQGIKPIRFLAAPEGVWTPTIEKVAKRYFLLARSSTEAYDSALPQYPMYVKEPIQGSTSLDMARSWVDVAKANQYLICILMHGIYPDGNGGGWWDRASFDGLIDYINAQGMPVITPSQLWGHLDMPLQLDY